MALVILTTALRLAADNFLSAYNLSVVVRPATFYGLVALKQTLVLLVGGIDLSAEAAGLSAIVGSIALTQSGVHPWLVIPYTMAFGLLLGFVNSLFVAGLRLNPFIVTLTNWEVVAELTLAITQGYPIMPLGLPFQVFGKGEIGSVPVPVITLWVARLLLIWVRSQTRFGRNFSAVAGN